MKDESKPAAPSGKAKSRKSFLKYCGAAGLAVFGASAFGIYRSWDPIMAEDFGVSTENTGVENRENLVAALAHSSSRVVFASGDYVIDNSTDSPERGLSLDELYVVIEGFGGEFVMEEGARLVFTDKRRRGLFFLGGRGAEFRGLSSAFREPLPDERVVPEECFLFQDTTDTSIEGARVNGSASSGILFYRCVRPRVSGARISNTQADGLHFANCRNPRAEDIHTENTGDDGLAFVNYADSPDNKGGHARNITVKNSEARGISVVGQSDILIEDFEVDNTSVSGLLCARDEPFDTRVPASVVFRNGVVRNAGRFPGQEANKYGIEIDAVDSVEFRGVEVESSVGRGVSSVATRLVKGIPTNGAVRLSGVEVRDVELAAGFSLTGEAEESRPPGGMFDLENLTARNVGGTGIAVLGSSFARCENLASIDASKEDGQRRAFEFGRNSLVQSSRLDVRDGQEAPTGFRVAAYGPQQSGTLGAVHDGVSNGAVEIGNESGLSYITPPVPTILPGGGSGSRVRLAWSGQEPMGISAYELQRSVDGGEYSNVPIEDAASSAVVLAPEAERTYRFRVRAVSRGGGGGAWATGEPFTLPA